MKNQSVFVSAVFVAFLTAASFTFAGQVVIYVDSNAVGANTGLNWGDAYNYLQDALADANSGDEIRVAQGTYKPDEGSGFTSGDREATFQLVSGVSIKGGYPGANEPGSLPLPPVAKKTIIFTETSEPDPNVRDIYRYKTILSGDLNGDDIYVDDPCELLDHTTRDDNSYHVIDSSNTDESTVLDGLIITAGNANIHMDPYHRGGGIFNGLEGRPGSLTIINCIVRENSAYYDGGGKLKGVRNLFWSPSWS